MRIYLHLKEQYNEICMSIHIQYIRNSVIRSAIACTHFPENNGEIRKNDTTQSGSNFDTYSTFVNLQATFAKCCIFSPCLWALVWCWARRWWWTGPRWRWRWTRRSTTATTAIGNTVYQLIYHNSNREYRSLSTKTTTDNIEIVSK